MIPGLLAKSHLTNMLRLLITHVQVKPTQETRLVKITSEYQHMPASINDCLITKIRSYNASIELVHIRRTNAWKSNVQGD